MSLWVWSEVCLTWEFGGAARGRAVLSYWYPGPALCFFLRMAECRFSSTWWKQRRCSDTPRVLLEQQITAFSQKQCRVPCSCSMSCAVTIQGSGCPRGCASDLCCHLWSLLAALFHRGHRAVQPRLWPLQHLPGFSLGIPRMCWEERSCHVDLEARYASGTGCLAPSSLVLAFRSSKLALAGSPSTLQGTFQWFSCQWAGDGCCGKGKITSLLSCFILIENLTSNLLSRRLFS